MSQNIKTKFCGFNCGKKIYWDNNKNQYLELMTKQKHICPNRNKPQGATNTVNVSTGQAGGTSTQPQFKTREYRYQQPVTQNIERPKMANSFELLSGSVRDIRKQYEYLSELIREAGGKVHGSQRGQDQERMMDIIVYYEVPELSRLGVQDKFDKFCKNEVA